MNERKKILKEIKYVLFHKHILKNKNDKILIGNLLALVKIKSYDFKGDFIQRFKKEKELVLRIYFN
ncbi:hypothetical protein D8B46_10000 [Candidatus Gracilibacteria bacterium]|nr:MAG: hypothetical protein D8B46_10000 [Candidatus Gracilibacteria bacterium]